MDPAPSASGAPPTTSPFAPAVPAGPIEGDRACVQCGYNLVGLQASGVCPECGTPVADSLRGKLLKYCSDQYLGRLHLGVFLVQTGLIIKILMVFAAVGATIAFPAATTTVNSIGSMAGLAVSAMLLWGWWLFSELDPGYVGQDAGGRPRRVVRVAVLIQAAAAVATVLAQVIAPMTAGTDAAQSAAMLHLAINGVGIIAWAVQYFASMLYVQWLVARVPNEKARKRARTLMWLGPVLYTVGIILLGLGPLIALVLYWNLLDWVRKDLKQIRAAKVAAGAP